MRTPFIPVLLVALGLPLYSQEPEPKTVISPQGVTGQEPAPEPVPEVTEVPPAPEVIEVPAVEAPLLEALETPPLELIVEVAEPQEPEASAPAAPAAKRALDMETAEHWGSASGASFSNDGKWIRFTHNPAGEDAESVVHVREARGKTAYALERTSSVQFSEDSRYLLYLEAPEKKEGEEEEEEEEAERPAPGPRGPGARPGFGGGRGGNGGGARVVRKLVMLELASGQRTEIERVRSFRLPAEATNWLAYVPAPPEKEENEESAESGAEGEGPAAGARGGRFGGRSGERGARGGRGGRAGAVRPEGQGGRRQGPPQTPTGEPGEPGPVTPTVEATPAAPAVGPVGPGAPAAAQEPARPVGVAKPAEGQEPPTPTAVAAQEPEVEEEEDKPKTNSSDGDDLVLRNLADGSEQKLEHVSSHRFTKDGGMLIYITSTKDEGGDAVWVRDLAAGTGRALLEGEGDYRSLTLSDDEARIALASNIADFQAEEPAWQIYYAAMTDAEAYPVVAGGHPSLPEDYRIASSGLGFSDSGSRLFFNVQPPEAEEPEEIEEDEKVVLDVWAWTDDQLQPQQLRSASRDRNPSYQAVIHVDKVGRVVTLTDETLTSVRIPVGRDARWGLASDGSAWAKMRSWETNLPADVYLVDIESGERHLILPAHIGSPGFSPAGNWLSWWNPVEREYYAMQVPDGKPRVISAGVPHPLENVLHDTPQLPRSAGTAGWLKDDAGYLVYDRYDLWQLDPTGTSDPICLTEGVGRELGVRFRRIDIEPSDDEGGGGGRFIPGVGFVGGGGGGDDGIDPSKTLHLSAFHLTRKSSGWWKDSFAGGKPVEILTEDARLSNPRPAKEGGLLTYTRSTFREYGDIWLTDSEFSFHEKLSNANPQQDEFLWGDAELFAWNSTDGIPLQGILVKPEGFDPARKYPMVVYFYERMSDGLHQHRSPGPGGSSVAMPFYASNGYLVFVPDIPYRDGYPGESAENAILPALSKLIDTGFVDANAIGVQGHSWGGYQIAHLVTRTNIFTAAISGAPVSNMVSAYGGIRWSSGMSRMFQYERTQSRLGGTLWEVPMRFLENSPIFYMDKVETPVLILHNDEDGAVPWYQGIEFFVALRRLGKPGWMLNYNGENHGLRKAQNKRDYAIRMYQFFDHYLRGAPMPVWMHEGVPAKDKGRTLGLDLVPGTGRDGR